VVPVQAQRERERAQRRVNEAVEPELMARAMLRPEDDDIRAVDLPERLQMAPVPLPDDPDWHACARCARALGMQGTSPIGGQRQASLETKGTRRRSRAVGGQQARARGLRARGATRPGSGGFRGRLRYQGRRRRTACQGREGG